MSVTRRASEAVFMPFLTLVITPGPVKKVRNLTACAHSYLSDYMYSLL